MKVKYFFGDNTLPQKLLIHPERVLKKLTKKGYHKCWAYQESIKNKFYLKSPMDFEFVFLPEINSKLPIIKHENKDLEGANNRVFLKENDQVFDNEIVFQLDACNVVFYSDEPCWIEQQQYFGSSFQIVTGTYDISKWKRRLSFACLTKPHKKIKIDRGDILCQVGFYCKNPRETITLEYIENPPKKLIEESFINPLITTFVKKTKKLILGE